MAFRLLVVARVISFVGDSLSLVALMLHVAQTTGQALAVAALLLAGDFVPALLSPLSGAVSDRFDRRRVMIVCELVQAALLVPDRAQPAAAATAARAGGRPGDHRAGVPAGLAGRGAGAGPGRVNWSPRTPRWVSGPTAPRCWDRCWPPRCCR